MLDGGSMLKLDKYITKVAKESGLSTHDIEVINKNGIIDVIVRTSRGKSFMNELMEYIIFTLATRTNQRAQTQLKTQ